MMIPDDSQHPDSQRRELVPWNHLESGRLNTYGAPHFINCTLLYGTLKGIGDSEDDVA